MEIDMPSGWTRDYVKNTATREDGATLTPSPMSARVAYTLVYRTPDDPDLIHVTIPARDLDGAVAAADRVRPPEPWDVTGRGTQWAAPGGWIVRRTPDGWTVLRRKDDALVPVPVTKRLFASADRARVWAETRFDQDDSARRGPKPRAGAASSTTLPDVRVTPGERANAVELAGTLGVSFSDLIRASLSLVRSLTADTGEYALVRPRGERGVQLVPAEKVEVRSSGAAYVGEQRVAVVYGRGKAAS